MEYEIDEILIDRNSKFREIPKWGTYLRKRWEESFADHLNDQEKSDIYLFDDNGLCGYLWHLFSYKKKDCLKGEKAKTAFNQETKRSCYIFYQNSDYAVVVESAAALQAIDFEQQEDVYVVDTEFTWTYVQTHEDECGPYFSRK